MRNGFYIGFVVLAGGAALSVSTRFDNDYPASIAARELAIDLQSAGEQVIQYGWCMDTDKGGIFPLAIPA
jgi:hypothetical protein